jgi:thiamine biosynthesis lipoprotein
MDTIATVTIHADSETADAAITAVFAELERLEGIFSYTNPDSELNRVNAEAYARPVEVSEDMAFLIREGLRLSELTGGAFDISLGALIELWRCDSPSEEAAAALLPNLGYENILFEDGRVRFANDSVKMHFGAIAKGYALDKTQEILSDYRTGSAIFDIGGEIGVTYDENQWKIGIRDPFGAHEHIGVISISQGAVATSGAYERKDHILDPKTGRPAQSEFVSVTVYSQSGTMADALSTAIFVAGESMAESLLSYTKEVCIVTICKDGEITNYCGSSHSGGGVCFTPRASANRQRTIRQLR